MTIFRQHRGVVSEDDVWVCMANNRLWMEESFWKLLWHVATEWNDEKHLVG